MPTTATEAADALGAVRADTGAPVVIDGVSKRFGATQAVDDVSLDVTPGEIVALLGPSGCGKTTLLRILAGLEAPDAGTVTVGGDLLSAPGRLVPPERRRLGMVFQDWALFPHLTVAGNVAFGLSREQAAAGLVDATLDLVHLRHLSERKPHELSGGQAQRVALARSLAPRPRVMLFDEAFSNLDTELRVAVRSEVTEILRALRLTAVFVTHDQEEAFVLGDRVAVMRGGRLVQADTPAELYEHPVDPWVASFVGEANLFPAVAGAEHARTAVGAIRLKAALQGACQVLVRPEHLHIAAEPAGSTSGPGAAGTVTGVEFYGHDTSYRVSVGDGAIGVRGEPGSVLVRSMSAPRFRTGDRVSLRYDGPDSVAFASA